MKSQSFVRTLVSAALGVCLLGAGALCAAGCSSSTGSSTSEEVTVRMGTMPTEDMLPAWVAEADGLFDEEGVSVEILTFDSASALSAAIAAGEVDMAMVDVPRAVKLSESGTPVDMEWVTLGTEASQGAFGVMAAADAPYSTLTEMAAYVRDSAASLEGMGVGVAANTVPEYVYEKLLEQNGIDPADIPTEEVASLPERYSLMASGNLLAAALPGSMLELGKANGLKLLADDTQGDNVSQSVMIARESFAAEQGEAMLKVAKAWDAAVDAIAANPESYIPLLAEKANLNETIADTYPVSDYPYALNGDELAHPAAELVDPQIAWMTTKGYVSSAVTYDEASGGFVIG